MNENYEKLLERIGKDKFKIGEPLLGYTTYKIGGIADLFLEVETEEELVRILGGVRELKMPYFILGAGSNLLVGDKGFRGVVIKVQSSKFKVQSCNVYAEAGVMISVLLNELTENSLTGLEFLAGIPGTVGGAVRGNAGAWNQSISERISRVKILTKDGEIKWLEKDECEFDYRDSRFKKTGEIILVAELDLTKGEQNEIKERIEENLEKRRTQPHEPSAGCIFVNPRPASAGQLIDQCGLKGKRIGDAQISEKHANFIVNLGNAKAVDVVSLIDLIKISVKEKFGIDLKEEIVKIGEF